jgi:hypothetical protein
MRWLLRAGLVYAAAACASPVGEREPSARERLERRAIRVAENPILSDGNHYSSDPAPFVVGGQLYILTGRDTAPPNVNDFRMPEWQLLVANKNPMDGGWTHYPHLARPEKVFAWATPGRAYAAQVVRAQGRFYMYAPVVHAASTARDKFGIGVAVASSPFGPWVDAHPAGPIVSQLYPVANDLHNIDPTVLIDDDGRAFMYWGSFGRLKGVELERDMVTFKGPAVNVTTLNGARITWPTQ